jgi:acetoin utilization deacetylase AcuC-like enzyme
MISRLGIIHHADCLKHTAGLRHPERPERLTAIVSALKTGGIWDRAVHIETREAKEPDLLLCHTAAHGARVREACAAGLPLAPDTGTCPESWRAALLAAGAGPAAADALAEGKIKRAFCVVRPPGHHAGPDSARGFCLFNNVAIAARYLSRRKEFGRVAIVDFDLHHGNGTQEILRADRDVMYCSTHQYGPNPLNPSVPFYPGTGEESERGQGAGSGLTVNVPVPAGAGYEAFERAFALRIVPALERFGPEVILISAGFDAHREDPLGSLELTAEDFGSLTMELVEIADRLCGGRIISILEGGYHPLALAASAASHARALL